MNYWRKGSCVSVGALSCVASSHIVSPCLLGRAALCIALFFFSTLHFSMCRCQDNGVWLVHLYLSTSVSVWMFVPVATFKKFYLYHSLSVHLRCCVVLGKIHLYLHLCLCLSILIVSQVSLLCSAGTCANERSRKNRTEQRFVRKKTEREKGKEDRNTARREKSDERRNDRGESRDEISTSRYIYINMCF